MIRTWSLKRQGEYRCPRCGGISNIFLSPLVYVFALLAVFAGGAIYFFHRFVLDDVDLFTCLQVLLPFALFFLLSLFLVYLAKPVIKRVPREEEKRGRRAPEPRRPGESRAFVDGGEYQSREASVPLQEAVPVSRPQAVESRAQQTTVLPSPARTSAPRRELQGPQMRPARPAPGEAAPVSRRRAAGESGPERPPLPLVLLCLEPGRFPPLRALCPPGLPLLKESGPDGRPLLPGRRPGRIPPLSGGLLLPGRNGPRSSLHPPRRPRPGGRQTRRRLPGGSMWSTVWTFPA